MIEKIINSLKDKKIAILGFGREGKSTYKFIRKYLKDEEVTIIDQVDIKDNNLEMFKDDNKVYFVSGDNYLDNLDKYDIIIKSPGISLNKIDISSFASKISSQMELLLSVAKDKVIGVTGTKGKSTTSSLIYEILKKKYKVLLAGNIGKPIFDLDLDEDVDYYVLEMSSHQLEYLDVAPRVGIILNLFQDHLDRALSVEHYHEIKMQMFKKQTENDYSIYCSSNDNLRKKVNETKLKGKLLAVDITGQDKNAFIKMIDNKVYYYDKVVFDCNLKRNILGNHNLENIMVCCMVGKLFEIEDETILKVVSSFKSLPYRMEYVGEINEVKYYVDTLATIPEATEEAIKALDKIDTLIFGGMDRGISYEEFVTFLQNSQINNFICMPKTGYDIGHKLKDKKVYYTEMIDEAVKVAKEVTKKGSICILSPAAASYEYFKNYQEKGDRFKELVLEEK